MQLILSKLNTLFRYPLLDKQLRASLVLTALSIAMLPENESRAKKQKLNHMLDTFISQVSKKNLLQQDSVIDTANYVYSGKENVMYAKVKEVLNNILNRFKSGDIPKAIAYSMFPIPDIPAAKWSLCNRTLMFIAGTADARGFNQWHQTGRHVKKGAKAFHILAPRFSKKENDDGEEEVFLSGFLAVPVFKYEDTEGDPLDYQQIELPELPLIDIAQQWGVSVRAIPGNYRYYGYFSPTKREISLATKEEVVFFHELSHAAHEKILGKLKGGQDWKQEIVAELSAAVLCNMVGKDGDKYLGNAYTYIDNYASKAKLSPLKACFQVMSDVEKVLQEILVIKDENHDKDLQIAA